jgi:hypothetical protein
MSVLPSDPRLVVKAAPVANPSCVAILPTGYPESCEVDGDVAKPPDIEKLLKTIEQKLAARMLRKS